LARINFFGADELVDCGTGETGVVEFVRAVVSAAGRADPGAIKPITA
jgi:hypothetical protein